MSPSADLVAALGALALLATGSLPAHLLPGDDTTATPSASASPRANTLPVQANVLDIRSTVLDLDGAVSTVTGARTIDVTVSASVLFAKDSAVLLPAARARLTQVGAQLKAAAPGTVQVAGYTDDLGTAEHGIDLSTRRATAVRDALGNTVAGKQVSVVGKGEAEPLVPNTDEASRARNRRVVIHYVAT